LKKERWEKRSRPFRVISALPATGLPDQLATVGGNPSVGFHPVEPVVSGPKLHAFGQLVVGVNKGIALRAYRARDPTQRIDAHEWSLWTKNVVKLENWHVVPLPSVSRTARQPSTPQAEDYRDGRCTCVTQERRRIRLFPSTEAQGFGYMWTWST
jgi:hypothetical protein